MSDSKLQAHRNSHIIYTIRYFETEIVRTREELAYRKESLKKAIFSGISSSAIKARRQEIIRVEETLDGFKFAYKTVRSRLTTSTS